MIMYVVYQVTNQINQKSYIGFTKRTLDIRRRQHIHHANLGSQLYFHRALRKYDSTDWNWNVLIECDTRDEASNHEMQLIDKYKTFADHNKGYNCTTGGEGGWKPTKETREKQSKANLGRKLGPQSKEKRNNISKAKKGCITWSKGKTFSTAYRNKLSEAWQHRIITSCPHCDVKSKNNGAMNRWHFDNCKLKPLTR